MTDSNRSTFIIAGAIVFAGIIIAAGVLFGGNGNSNSASNVADKNQKQEQSGSVDIAAAAEAAGVDGSEVQNCLDQNKFQSDIRSEIRDARSAVDQRIGTPFNVLILENPLTDQTKSNLANQFGGSENFTISEDGKRIAISGAFPFEPFKQIIDQVIAGQKSSGDRSSDDIGIAPISEDDHIRGSRNAALTVVEYSDFKCPYCTQFHQTMKRVIENYEGDQVAWVLRHMPIQQLHPQAPELAQASECVADIGGEDAFWKFADEVFAG